MGITNFRPLINRELLEKATQLTPKLIETEIRPQSLIKVHMGEADWESSVISGVENINEKELRKGDSLCLDFGDHMVGYVSFDISSSVNLADAPAYLRLKFGESLCEIGEDSADYQGGLSSGWIQEEYIHIDCIPSRVELPRRYAFRYMELLVKDTSQAYGIKIDNIVCKAVSSADMRLVEKLKTDDEFLKQIDKVSLKTMHDCMQEVFEDGPKRDRRLWIGDLRLQALTNYETFKNYDLAKRCIYLFASLLLNEGKVTACLYVKPTATPGEVSLFDYSLFFISCLYDYYNATEDREFLEEMYPTALAQAEFASERIGEDGLVCDSDTWWCFLDWNDKLNKQAGAQAVFIYALKQLEVLAKTLRKDTKYINSLIKKLTEGAINKLWDEEKGFFTSGKDRQISWISQIWFVLAGVFETEKNILLLERLEKVNPPVGMVTPYAYHHYIDALIQCGMLEKAKEKMCGYWGEMVKDGADCFYELYDPNDKKISPYGSRVINSYCHAWSGTPSYFIRKYFVK